MFLWVGEVESRLYKVGVEIMKEYRCRKCEYRFCSENGIPYCPACDCEDLEEIYEEDKRIKKIELKATAKILLYKKVLSEEDKIFLKKLIQNHPNAEQKIGVGIEDFFTFRTIYKTMGFGLLRTDSTTTDFSYLQCLNPRTNNQKIKMACRTAISKSILNFKTDKTKIVHHKGIEFNEITERWLKEFSDLDLNLNKTEDNCQEVYFSNNNTAESFRKFHDKLAVLVEISTEHHKKIHGGVK